MKRGLAWFLVAWMMFLTVWTAVLAVAVFDHEPESVAYAGAAAVLDVRDPVVVRWEPGAGSVNQEVLPPKTMPLWQYVEGETRSAESHLSEFERAFERDLASGDKTFHETHEVIDGRQW